MKVRSAVYDLYWQMAYERQEIFFKKLQGQQAPYTLDPILSTYKFCNVYRASDRVSQFLLKKVIYTGEEFSEKDLLLRIIFFRLLNKTETWEALESELGTLRLTNYSTKTISSYLKSLKAKQPIYGNAFILCANKAFGFDQKHDNHLALLDHIFNKTMFSEKILESKSLEELFWNLKSLPLIGNFMAYQIAIDLNYSTLFDFSENDFTIAGPGAIRGISKAFLDTEGKKSDYIIKYMVDNQEKEFTRLGLPFRSLWGRSMHAIDCQGMFCELDKYTRVKFPQLKSNRSKIKARYAASPKPINYFYPPKWKLTIN